jgi:transcriptional regulator of met regulon
VLSSEGEVEAIVHAFEGQPLELIRSDLSVPDQDRLRSAVQQARQGEEGNKPQ